MLTLGCEERITGPEAVQIVRALDEGLTSDSLRRDFWLGQAMGASGLLGPLWRSAAATTTLTVRRDDTPVEYQAIVLERVPIPPHDLSQDTNVCRFANSWALLLWRHSNPTEEVGLIGQRFDRPIYAVSPPCGAPNWAEVGPFLSMTRLPPDWREGSQVPRQFGWIARGGTADISPGRGSGDCGLTPEDAKILMDDMAVTCQRTIHRVRFHAAMVSIPQWRQPADPALRRFTLDLPEIEVVGVRYTIHCDERPKSELCHP